MPIFSLKTQEHLIYMWAAFYVEKQTDQFSELFLCSLTLCWPLVVMLIRAGIKQLSKFTNKAAAENIRIIFLAGKGKYVILLQLRINKTKQKPIF